ncbi:MAG: L-serine ammonia-lyase, iron-sulfur-dependent, subunit alpha [Bacteroidia bacterium]
MFTFDSFAGWLVYAQGKQFALWQVVVEYEICQKGRTEKEIWERLAQVYAVMWDAVETGLTQERVSWSGMVQNGGKKVFHAPIAVLGEPFKRLIAYATAAKETNACMGRVVAAPTAGASGILPGILRMLEEYHKVSRSTLYEAMLIASGVALIMEKRASIAGAVGGCQAETGTAAAMGAAAIVYALGGSSEAIFESVAITVMNMLGLICDPVAGLVELPCVKRNASAAAIAFTSAQLALAGDTAIIPVDEIVEVMGQVGQAMDPRYKETALGGIAATPTAQAIAKKIWGTSEISYEDPIQDP